MTKGPLYLVTERFDASRGAAWRSCVEWIDLPQLTELVSVDGTLCDHVADEIRDDDWPHLLAEDFMLHWYTDLPYLLRRCGSIEGRNMLCAFRDPERQPEPPSAPFDWVYEGCDLVDVKSGPSALTNCGGGFPLAFRGDEVTPHGLIASLDRAKEIQRALREHYPDEHHANCHVWSVFRAR
jgi:hypothetical protein